MKTVSAIIILVVLTPPLLHAQCSDAGVCSVGKHESTLYHAVGFSYAFGKSGKEDDLKFHTIGFDATIRAFQETRLIVSLAWSSQSGPLGSTSGLGDLSLLVHHMLSRGTSGQWNIQFGGKFATGEVHGADLPQAYQSGLGTNDLLFGLSYAKDKLTAAVGYQLSRGRSENRLTRLKRGDDLMLRAGYEVTASSLRTHLELLAIKRLHKSSVRAFTVTPTEQFVEVEGSNQLQVNVVGRAIYPLADQYSLQVLAAIPLLKRDVNLDGLTRAVTVSAGIQFSF
jgi:hypothetical protein